MYRLLIIHEDPAVCAELLRVLDWRRLGFHSTVSASSYDEALGKALDLMPHVVLIGVQLGSRFGYDLVSQLRHQGAKTVFAMVSDSEDAVAMRKSMQAGARDFLVRPVEAKELRAFAERVIVGELGGKLPHRSGDADKIDPVLNMEYQSLSKITNKIILYTRSHYRSPLSLVSMAEVFKMSSKYMGRVFLQDTGFKYSEYLMAYRMMEARKLIVGTQNKISVIANMVGYSQLNNFYIHFKRFYGMSPGDLRNPDAEETK